MSTDSVREVLDLYNFDEELVFSTIRAIEDHERCNETVDPSYAAMQKTIIRLADIIRTQNEAMTRRVKPSKKGSLEDFDFNERERDVIRACVDYAHKPYNDIGHNLKLIVAKMYNLFIKE